MTLARAIALPKAVDRRRRLRKRRRPRTANRPTRRLQLEILSARLCLTGVDYVSVESTVFQTCHPEVDTHHYHYEENESVDVSTAVRQFSIVSYDTGHVPGKTDDVGAVFDRCIEDVPPGVGGDEVTLDTWHFPDEQLLIAAYLKPGNLAQPMTLNVAGESVQADRLAVSREISSNDFRQFLSITSDGFIRTTTLPNAPNFVDDQFGLSVGIGPMQEQTLPSGETRLIGQISEATISPLALPKMSLTFGDGGTASIVTRTLDDQLSRFDVSLSHGDATRLVVIGANPQTSRTEPESLDVLSDFSAVMYQTETGEPLDIGHAQQTGDAVSQVTRTAYFQAEKSQHNPLDPSLAILIGAGITSDGFGDVALSEAEDGSHSSQVMSRGRASGNHADHQTVDLVTGQTLSGTISPDTLGWARPFIRYSLDAAAAAQLEVGVQGQSTIIDLLPTTTADSDPGEAWNLFQTHYLEPIVVSSQDIAYSLEMLSGHAEIDTAGLLFVGDPDPYPWHNRAENTDINDDGAIDPRDVALAVSNLIVRGPGELPRRPEGPTVPFLDVLPNNVFVPQDIVLLVARLLQDFEVEGEAPRQDGGLTEAGGKLALPPLQSVVAARSGAVDGAVLRGSSQVLPHHDSDRDQAVALLPAQPQATGAPAVRELHDACFSAWEAAEAGNERLTGDFETLLDLLATDASAAATR